MKAKLFIFVVFLVSVTNVIGQTQKPTIAETKKWIADKLSLYARGFTMTNEVRKPGVILGNRMSTYEINQVSYTQSNLVFEYRVSTYLKNCCQEHTTSTILTITIPWTIFRSETNFRFTPKDSLTTGKLFEPSGNCAVFFIADGNQINFSQEITQVVHKNLNIDNGTTESTEESTEPASSQNTSACFMGINITGEQNLRQRLQKAFTDLTKYNKSKGEAY